MPTQICMEKPRKVNLTHPKVHALECDGNFTVWSESSCTRHQNSREQEREKVNVVQKEKMHPQ